MLLLDSIDEPSRRLILEILEQDAIDASNSSKGKQRADHKMAKSIAKAVLEDGVALTIAAQEENRALADRKLAFQLAGQRPPPTQGQPLKLPQYLLGEDIASELDDELEEFLLQDGPNKRRCTAESSQSATNRNVNQLRRECVACTELKLASEMLQAQCPHWYCNGCVIRLVKDSLVDESLFPPRCCRKAFPLSTMRKYIDADLSRRFEDKEIEHKDPYRTYCSNAGCAKYILPPFLDGYVGTCQSCHSRTCTLCKRAAHIGKCVDEHDEVMNLAKQSGWQQCPQCSHLIELSTGCNHITVKWKKCGCATWDENRLLDRAQVLAARNVAAAQIREVQHCTHPGRWLRVDEEDNCEERGQYLPDFILECRNSLHSALNLGIFNKGKRSSPVKTRVLDHGFSESDFFNKSSVNEQNDQTLQQKNRLSMFNYDTRIEDPRQMNHWPRTELLRPSMEESPRVRLNSLDVGITHGDTATYDELEPRDPAIVDAAPGPFSQLGNQSFEHEKQDILHEKTTVNNWMDDSRVVEALEKYLCSADTRAAEYSGKKYWSLEDLKHLMQQRISRWLPEDKDSTSAHISGPQQFSLKRKHDSTQIGTGISSEIRKKRERVPEPRQKLDGNPAGRSTSSHVTLLGPCSFFDQPISVSATERFFEHKHMNHAPEGRYFQPQRPFRDIRPSMTHNNDTSLISEAFDAAYEAIMQSETDVRHRLPDFPPIGDTIIGRPEDSMAASVLQAPWMWESQREEELNPFQLRQELPPSHRRLPGSIPETTQARQIIDQLLYLGDSCASQVPKFSVELEPAFEPGQTFGRGKLEVNQHDFDIGPLKDFWLSSKLY
ncbi:hypothetical protein BJX62DRAFT_250565 [Aspergillus germanicus]